MSTTQKPSNNTWRFVLKVAIIPIVIALISAIALIIGKSQTTIIIEPPSTITSAPTHQATTSSSPTADSTPTSPILSSFSIVFDNFNNGMEGWEIPPSNDINVSAAQDNGNGVLRFNPPNQGPAEAYKNVGSAVLSKFNKIYLRINLHGATLITPSDDANYQTASALYLDQNGGWKFVGLYDYIKNGYDGWQNVFIPLTDFKEFDKAASFSRLGFRFWLHKTGTIDIDDIKFMI